jgi:microcystin-dependent protein
MSDVPVGSVTAFAGPIASVPADWYVCDGRRLDRTVDAPLFNAIGVSWGGDGAPFFRIPDLRGQFLRGVDRDSTNTESLPARDPDRDNRSAANSTAEPNDPGNSGNMVGSVQADAFASHNHLGGNHHHTTGTQNGAKAQFGEIVVDIPGSSFPAATSDSGDVITPQGGAETRPKNAYVFWIIKAKP